MRHGIRTGGGRNIWRGRSRPQHARHSVFGRATSALTAVAARQLPRRGNAIKRWQVLMLSGLSVVSVSAVGMTVTATSASAAGTTLPTTTPYAFEDADGNMTCDGVNPGDCTANPPNYLDWNSSTVTGSGPAFINQPDTDPLCTGGQDQIFKSGTQENDVNVTVGCSPSTPKVALTWEYGWHQTVGSDTYLYLAWEAPNQSGSNNNHIDFELNQNPQQNAAPVGGGAWTLTRTVGDLLFDFDITPGSTIIAYSQWEANSVANSCPNGDAYCWTAEQTLSNAQAAVFMGPNKNSTMHDPLNGQDIPNGGFGEMGLDLTAAGLFNPGICTNFASVWVKGRSSGSGGTSELKSFMSPTPIDLSNCANPGIVTTASATALPAGSISDSGVLSGGTANIGGTLTFKAYGPFASAGVANCTSNLAFTQADPVNGNGTYTAGPHTVTGAGTYVWQVTYSGDNLNNKFTSTCGDTSNGNNEVSVVNPATPGLVTTASATALPSGSISDSGVFSGGSNATGTLTFKAYGPFASAGVANCTSNLAFTASDTVTGNGTYTAGPHTVTDAGIYVWQVTYNGDGNNTGFTTTCGDTNNGNSEVSTVGPATPGIVTTASATDLPSGSISDSGVFSGGSSPTGTLTFKAYGPFASAGVANCTSNLAFTQADTVNGNGTYTAGPHTVTGAGVYVWQVTYVDGTNNTGFTSTCGDTNNGNNEVSTVGPATPSMVTTAGATDLPSGSISDGGVLSGATTNAGGTLTFKAYGPFASAGVANCTASLAFTQVDNVSGLGTYTAGPHTVTDAGTYVWQVTYSGDGNNTGFTTTCGDTTNGNNEVSVVGKATPAIITTASATALPAGSISDSGSFSGATSTAGGTLTFNAYGPFASLAAANCTTSLAFTVGDPVSGNGTYTAGPHTVTNNGVYVWQVVYSGDSNNAGFTSTCGDKSNGNDEVSVVNPAGPDVITTGSATDLPSGSISDSGVLSGATANAGGTLTFNAYGPFASVAAANCTSTVVFSVADPVSGNGTYTAGPHTVTDAGTYVWQVVYSGDGANTGFTTGCGDTTAGNDEVSVVNPANPSMVTTAGATALPSGTISDGGVLSGATTNATGTLTFNAYGPFASAAVANCTSSLAFTVADTVNGLGTYTAGPHTVTAAGTYVWQVVYSGDGNNNGFTTVCGDTSNGNTEVSVVAPAGPGIVTTASATGMPNGTISDSGVFSGATTNATGTLTFNAYGPFSSAATANCTSTVAFTVADRVSGNGTYTAGPHSVTAAGTYVWQVVYSGDGNNSGFTSVCGDTTNGNNEVSVVAPPPPPPPPPPTSPSSPLLTASKTSTPVPGSTVSRGQTVTYGITLSNAGNAIASAVAVTDTVPAGTTYVPGSATCGGVPACVATEAAGVVSWTGVDVPAITGSTPGTVLLTFEAVVNQNDTNGQVIPNFALFSNENTPSCTDPNCDTNTVTLTVAVPATTPSPTTTTTLAPVVGATTVHTGKPWAGSMKIELMVAGFGLGLIGLGERQRRRQRRLAVRRQQS